MRLFARGRNAEEDVYRRLSFDPENNTILDEIAQAKKRIEDAYTKFQNASDPDLIDSYIYEGNAAWKKYEFLLRQMKPVSQGQGKMQSGTEYF